MTVSEGAAPPGDFRCHRPREPGAKIYALSVSVVAPSSDPQPAASALPEAPQAQKSDSGKVTEAAEASDREAGTTPALNARVDAQVLQAPDAAKAEVGGDSGQGLAEGASELRFSTLWDEGIYAASKCAKEASEKSQDNHISSEEYIQVSAAGIKNEADRIIALGKEASVIIKHVAIAYDPPFHADWIAKTLMVAMNEACDEIVNAMNAISEIE